MKTIGRYQVREAIGGGAMGQVWLAHDPVIQRNVAIKTLDRSKLPPAELDETVARFRREAIAAGRLTHPNIVTIYEYGEEGSLCFIAMEHAPGRTLHHMIATQRALPLPLVLTVGRQLFAALIYAHEQGIWHRDLKPANIVLTGDPTEAGELQAKVLDFGIARVNSAAAVTHVGTVVGTPGYMSPEQYLGEEVDARTDVYALGVTLFEMLTGSRTFNGSLHEVLEQVVHRDAPLASSLRPGLPPAIDAVLAKALSRGRTGRYANMRAFREAFVDAFVRSQLIEVPPVPAQPTPAPRSELPTISTPVRTGPRMAAGERPKILFVDDEERILGALSALFRLRYEVLVATDARDALELVRQHRPPVIVSDQRMPSMLGVDFLRQAREIDPSSVRILLTGYSDLAAIVGSINDGEVFRFVNKPWGNQEMRDTVAQAMEIAQSTRNAAAAPIVVADASEQRRAPEALLVAQRGGELFDLINAGFGRTRPVCHAADLAAVLQTIEDQEVAVLVCDLDAFENGPLMLKMLKQVHPQVQTIAISSESDSAQLISMINQAQLFRFLNRPVRLGLLDRALKSGLAAYANVKAQPVLAQRQRVEARAEVAESSLGRQIVQRLSMFMRPRRVAEALKGA